jgi:hypothetical protein
MQHLATARNLVCEMRTNPKREFLRHTIHVPLSVERPSDRGPVAGEGINVSYGGLAFLAEGCPSVGEVLKLRIDIVEPPFEAEARVAWCRPEGTGFLVGVQFLHSRAAFQSRMVQQVCSIENYRIEAEQREGRSLTTQDAAAEWIEKYAGRFPDSETLYPDDTAA